MSDLFRDVCSALSSMLITLACIGAGLALLLLVARISAHF